MRRSDVLGIAVLAVALTLRLSGLDREPLTTNEATSAALARDSWGTLVYKTAHDVHPPFYYLFLNAWVRLFGDAEYSLRLPSALAGSMTAFVTYRWALSLMPATAAVLAGLIVGISPFHVHYSQEARFYGFLGLEAALFWLGLTRLMGRSDRRWFAATAAVGVVGLYTHYYFGMLAGALLATCILCGILREKARTLAGRAVLLAGVMAAVYGPWLPSLVRHTTGPGAGSTGPVTPGILVHTLRYFMSYDPDIQPWRLLSFILLGLVLTMGLVRWKAMRDRLVVYFPQDAHEFLPTVGLVATVGVVFAVCTLRPLYIEKGMVIVLPAYAAVAAAAWMRFPHRLPRALMAALALAVAARGLTEFYGTSRNKDWPKVADLLTARGQAGDLLVLREGLIEVPLHYYYLRSAPEQRLPELLLHCHLQTTSEQLAMVERSAAGMKRLWLVHAHTADTSLRDSLLLQTSSRPSLGRWSFGEEGEVLLFGNNRPD